MTDFKSNISLAGIAGAISPVSVIGRADSRVVSGLSADSRMIEPGAVFVAVEGVDVDGHRFIPAAIKAGAMAVICRKLPENPSTEVCWMQVADSRRALGLAASAYYGHPSQQITLIGVTGTNGKTTVATLLYQMARLNGEKAGLLSTVANIINNTAEPAQHTTPDPIHLNSLLRRMVDAGCTFAAMEVSSHAADQKRIAGLNFDGGVFTNLTRDHLDYHKTVQAYLKAKKTFFDELPSTAFALVNADDRNAAVMLQNCAARHFSFSLTGTADYNVRVLADRMDGMSLEFDGTGLETPFVGRFNASNLAAVYAAFRILGLPKEQTLLDISRLEPVSGRFQCFRSADGVTGIVDFAHTPDALANVLDTINRTSTPGARIFVVTGAGGDRDRGKRPLMARACADRCSYLMLTADNPRHEDVMDIIAEMKSGLTDEQLNMTTVEPDRRTAIRRAVASAQPGDIVLVAGKGHETTQQCGDEITHFDDREEVAAALALRNI